MNWQEQQALSFVIEKMREIPAHHEHGVVELELLQALQRTKQGWTGQVCQSLLNALEQEKQGREVEEKLLELASVLIRWSIVLERERNQQPSSLQEGEEVFVIFPDKKLKYLGVILPDRKIAIEHLNKTVSMGEVHFFRKKKKQGNPSSGSDSLQKTISEELFKLGIQLK